MMLLGEEKTTPSNLSTALALNIVGSLLATIIYALLRKKRR